MRRSLHSLQSTELLRCMSLLLALFGSRAGIRLQSVTRAKADMADQSGYFRLSIPLRNFDIANCQIKAGRPRNGWEVVR
jgi:hypothetical protein